MSKVSKLFSKNKKVLFFVIGLGLVLFLLSWQYVEADLIAYGPDGTPYTLCEGCGAWPHQWPNCIVCFVKYIASLPVRIVFAVIVGIIGLGALVAGLLYAVIAAITNWLIGIIMTVGVVPGNPLTPRIIEIGWEFSRDFANLFFLLALAFIGLATVLRIREYEMKKALPTLIIIALLINFTPVIVGFIVDMGNIVTKFFLDHAGSINTMGDTLNMAKDYLVKSLARIFLEDGEFFEKFGEIILKFLFITVYGLALLVFFLFAAFVYFLIGVIFIFRTIILWILMILSPIAFLSKVFPNTRTTKMVFPDILHWDKWWETLIQWTIIGIPIGFFLYLSNLVMSATYRADIEGIFDITNLGVTLEETASSTFSFTSTSTEFIAELSGLQAGFVDLFASLFAPTIAVVLLGMGALISFKAVPTGAKGIVIWTQRRGRAAGKAAAGVARGIPAVSRAEEAARRRLERAPLLGRAIGGPGAYVVELERERKKAGRNLESLSSDEIRNVIRMRAITREDRLRRTRGIELLVERNRIEEQDRPYVQEALTYGLHRGTIYDKMPHWDPNIRQRVEGMDIEEFRKNVRPQAFETQPGVHTKENLEVFYSADLRKVSDLGEKGRRAQKEALRNLIIAREPDITAQIAQLRATGRPEDTREADKIEDMWIHIANHPNYIV